MTTMMPTRAAAMLISSGDPSRRRDHVTLVGAGVVNLVTALRLIDDGFSVRVVDAAADPRRDCAWQDFGCSRGGGNARMFTATEADEYSGQRSSMAGLSVFSAEPEQGGWDIRRPGSPSLPDRDWVARYEAITPSEAASNRAAIFDVTRRAGVAWDTLFTAHPQLAESVQLRRGIVRVYGSEVAFRAAVHRHRRVGDLVAVHPEAQINDVAPAVRGAAPGALAGGITVRGFTVSVHDLIGHIVDLLESSGAELLFDTAVLGLERDSSGRPCGLQLASGSLPVTNVVMSLGAYGNELLHDLGEPRRIGGVLGLWHTLPNLHGQTRSMKVSRPGTVAPDANVTVGRAGDEDVLVVGSGYGFVGCDVTNIDDDRLRAIHLGVDEMTRELFPDAHEAAGGSAWLDGPPQYCIRPWTPDSLGVFEEHAATSGVCIVTGGHNTGGFAQAPDVANAVLASLRGQAHPMHHLYGRGRLAVTGSAS